MVVERESVEVSESGQEGTEHMGAYWVRRLRDKGLRVRWG